MYILTEGAKEATSHSRTPLRVVIALLIPSFDLIWSLKRRVIRRERTLECFCSGLLFCLRLHTSLPVPSLRGSHQFSQHFSSKLHGHATATTATSFTAAFTSAFTAAFTSGSVVAPAARRKAAVEEAHGRHHGRGSTAAARTRRALRGGGEPELDREVKVAAHL